MQLRSLAFQGWTLACVLGEDVSLTWVRSANLPLTAEAAKRWPLLIMWIRREVNGKTCFK